MTTTRRMLGTGPNSTTSTAAETASGGRRLPAERADVRPLLAADEPELEPDATEAPIRSRRRLGNGSKLEDQGA